MMQLPCRSLGKVPRSLGRTKSKKCFPSANEIEGHQREPESAWDPRGNFRDGRNFPVAVTQIEFDRAGRVTAKQKAAEVSALVGAKDQPVGRTVPDCVRGARPVINR